MLAQLAPRVVQGLVEGAAGRLEVVGEDVDRHAVDRERQQDAPLVRGEDVADRLLDLPEELVLLRLGMRLEPAARAS